MLVAFDHGQRRRVEAGRGHRVADSVDAFALHVKRRRAKPFRIVVARTKGGKFHAYRNACPHQGVWLNIGSGAILDEAGAQIRCGRHGATFAIETGYCSSGACEGAFLRKVEHDEIIPHVAPVPATDLGEYYALIEERFSNPEIADTIRRLCLDGSNRQPKFIIPSLRDNLAKGTVPTGLILLSALWCRYCAGTTDSGAAIAPNDPNWDRLTATAKTAKADPAAWLGMADIYGETGRDPRVQAAFATALYAIWAKGTAAVLADYLAGKPL